MLSLPLSYKHKHTGFDDNYCLKKIRHCISLHSVSLSLSFSLSIYLLLSEGDTFIHIHVMVDGIFFCFHDSTREELMYSSPICIIYYIKKNYFTYIDDKKNLREKQVMHISLHILWWIYVYVWQKKVQKR